MNTGFKLRICSNNTGQKDLLAKGARASLICNTAVGAWNKAKSFLEAHKGETICAAFSYELKDDIESLHSLNPVFIPFPALVLFVPEWLEEVEPLAQDSTHYSKVSFDLDSPDKAQYIEHVSQLIAHIQYGDIYEANYCEEFQLKNLDIAPEEAFRRINGRTQAPYACHLQVEDKHLLCGSPELFLRREGNRIISSPIKGTRKRSKDAVIDAGLIAELKSDEKERAENVMITDLVRNDLSKSALPESVVVKELCKVYSFETVHQMISTVESQVSPEMNSMDVIKDCFPMGSMTGAPKIRAMQLIEKLETFKRGIYSGAVGLFYPDGDFTLNVVIRSLLYDQSNKCGSICAGGAITALSNPESEYEECLIKAHSILDAL